MKTMKPIPLFVLIALLAGNAHAEKGGNGSHGGNTELSSEAQAREAIRNAVLILPNLLYRWSASPETVQDVRARGIVAQVTEKTDYMGLADREDAPYYVVKNGSCRGAGAKKAAASAKVGKPEEKFCLSLSEIRRMPPLSLNEQVAPLIAHELAHQAGYGEADAQYFQNFLLGVYKRRPEYRAFYDLLNSAMFQTLELESAVRGNAGIGAICMFVGKLRAAQEQLSGLDRTMSPLLPNWAGDRAANLPGSRKLETSCEGGQPLGRDEIIAVARAIRSGLDKITDEVLAKTAHYTSMTEIFIPIRNKNKTKK